MQEVESQINNLKQQIQQLNTQLDVQSEKLNHSNQQIQILFQADRNIIARLQLGAIVYPANSCNDIPQYKPSGEYWIATNSSSSPVQVYCDMNRTSCSCNTKRMDESSQPRHDWPRPELPRWFQTSEQDRTTTAYLWQTWTRMCVYYLPN